MWRPLLYIYHDCTDLASKWSLEATHLAWRELDLSDHEGDELIFVLHYCGAYLSSRVAAKARRQELRSIAESWMTEPEIVVYGDTSDRSLLTLTARTQFYVCGRDLLAFL